MISWTPCNIIFLNHDTDKPHQYKLFGFMLTPKTLFQEDDVSERKMSKLVELKLLVGLTMEEAKQFLAAQEILVNGRPLFRTLYWTYLPHY